jgi:UrcA family protein
LNTTKAVATKVAQATWTILAAASISVLGSVAQASESGESAPQRTVGYADLNLTTTKGAAVMYSRLRNAAYEVCGSVYSSDLQPVAVSKPCIARAMKNAITAVNSPMLTSRYLASTGTTAYDVPTVAMSR